MAPINSELSTNQVLFKNLFHLSPVYEVFAEAAFKGP